jgi:MoxR-like ATPase
MNATQLHSLLTKTIPAKLPVLIVGEPGIGKSDIVDQACRDVGAKLIIEHPVVSDPTDFKGMPYAKDGKATFLPFGDLEDIINATTLTVYFLDDLGQAPASVQAACMQLLLARRINGFRVSDHVCFVAATNDHTHRAGVSGILEPVKSRFVTIVRLETDVEAWIAWALKMGLPTEIIAFIRFRPELLHKFEPTREIKNCPSPRTIHNIAKLMEMGVPQEIEFEVYAGAAGEGVATELVAFLKIFRQLPDIDYIIMHPEKVDIPDDPATLYALATAVARKATEQNIARIIEFAERLPIEYNVLLIHDAGRINQDITKTRAWIEWGSRHADVLL